MGNTCFPDPSTLVVLNAEKSFVHFSEAQWTEVDIPDAVIDLFQADVFTTKSLGDADPMSIPSDPTVAANEPNLEVSRILDWGHLSGESTFGSSVDRSRGLLSEGLMGPFEVVLLAERVEASLLGLEVARRWTGSLGLESSVHPLMSTVLFRVGGFDELRVDPEADPPDGESREAPQRGGGEGHAVIGTDDPRKAVLLEEAQENRLCQANRGRRESLTAKEKPTVAVDEGQGEAIDPIPRPELPLEVGSPNIVGLEHRGQWFSRMAWEATSSPSRDEAVALEDIVAGGAGGPVPARVPSGKHAQQLLGSPGWMAASTLEQALGDAGRALVRAGMGMPRTVLQTRRAFLSVPMKPLVGSFPADSEPTGQLGERGKLALVIGNKANSLVHGGSLLPRHWGTSSGAPSLLEVSPMYLDYSVTHVP
jgi:hypothetical protein